MPSASFMDADLARSGLLAIDVASTESTDAFSGAQSYRLPYYFPNGVMHPGMFRQRLQSPAPGRGKYTQPTKEMLVAAGFPEHTATMPYLNPRIVGASTWESVVAAPATQGNGKLYCLVEGEKKATAVGLFCGRLAIGIGGCANGCIKTPEGMPVLHPMLAEIFRPDDRVEIIFDADLHTNENVNLAAGTLRRALMIHGVRATFVLLPRNAGGIDDWLMGMPLANRVAAFESLPRAEFNRGELREDRVQLVTFLGVPIVDGKVISNESAVAAVLNKHERYRDRLWVEDTTDIFYESVTDGKPRPLTDAFINREAMWVQKNVNHAFTVPRVTNAIRAVPADPAAHRNELHDYVNALTWDQTPRLEEMFIAGWGADDNPYTRAVGRAWMVGVMARAFRPGCEMQTMLVLEGAQGIGKSRSLKMIGGKWYVETATKMDSKDFVLEGHRSLLFDLAELGAYKFADFSFAKALLSTAVDVLRAPYARAAEPRPRRFVVVATTNETNYLRDLTGNRRFWPIACTKIDLDWIEKNRDQLFAEAKALLDASTPWWIPDAITNVAQATRLVHDPWEDLLRSVLMTATQAPPLQIGKQYYNFISSSALLKALGINDGQANSGHWMRLHALMTTYFPEWEKYFYNQPHKPISLHGALVTAARGFRTSYTSMSLPMNNIIPLTPPANPFNG